MSYTTFDTAIPAAVHAIKGDDFDVIWDRATTGTRDLTHVKLRIMADRHVGWDETRRVEILDDLGQPTGMAKDVISGNRQLVIQFFCESDDQPLGAMTLAEDLIAGLQDLPARALLSAANMGAATFGPSMDASYPDDDGRWLSAVMFEATFPRVVIRESAPFSLVAAVGVAGVVDGHTIGPFTVDRPDPEP